MVIGDTNVTALTVANNNVAPSPNTPALWFLKKRNVVIPSAIAPVKCRHEIITSDVKIFVSKIIA